jgi:TfoX/Sxy family transcriptional regulator of competence genes
MPAKPQTQMPGWRKSPPTLVARLDALLCHAPGAERRQMFGYPCAFLHGNMFIGLFQDQLFIRLSEADRKEFLQQPGAAPFEPIKGRPMKEYVTAPEVLLADESALERWLARSLAYAGTLPPREKKRGGRA